MGLPTTPASGQEFEISLPAALVSVPQGRHALTDYCTRRRVPDGQCYDGLLAASELMTNAVLHAGTPFLLWAGYDEAHLILAVHDGSASSPALFSVDDGDREGARGPRIVDELGATSGVVRTPLGTLVWVDLAPPMALPTQQR